MGRLWVDRTRGTHGGLLLSRKFHRGLLPLTLNAAIRLQMDASSCDPVVSSVTWLEDELEFNALHNPGSCRGSGDEKAAVAHSAALSAALGGRVDVGGMSTISGRSHI
ncbi:phosphatidylinositol 4-kinase alpha 1-like isoform X2 [Syzygium oleosum]|uniref:phosphatidylinositol 4-kinase alpha 1-like isoform X2 n=1 Tax=Syzygium oleosum TaxID=219896 RepID=UPI0024BA8667|nr:phosphatidylinositol 4-kinase alpha 1-like isoform X2 [Syzygium oleosum]